MCTMKKHPDQSHGYIHTAITVLEESSSLRKSTNDESMMMKDWCEGRFLMTFDDGPHVNTALILEQLAHNPVQQGIRAMFFVQTRNGEGGRSELGRFLLQREHAEGHVLGLHTGTAGHVSHTSLSKHELAWSLRTGMEDMRLVTHERAMFVRPPYWRFNADTQA